MSGSANRAVPVRTRGDSLPKARLRTVAVVAIAVAGVGLFLLGSTAGAIIVPTVPLATSANYAVLGGSTVTNIGPSVVNGMSVGLSPGPSITGFPPGVVTPPGTIDQTNAAAAQAQLDLATAYNNAAGRSVDANTTADLANLVLVGGVYAAPGNGALSLTGPLVLDGEGDPNSVFIFQTDSTLVTGSASSVSLINGAQECNVFWQVGSSATLGSGSSFAGNILALTSISIANGVTVRGRALARNGAVTLINDVFTAPTCELGGGTTTTGGPTTTGGGPTTTTGGPTTTGGGPTTTTGGPTTTSGATTTTSGPGASTTTTSGPGASTTTTSGPGASTTTTSGSGGSTTTAPTGGSTSTVPFTTIPRTGSDSGSALKVAGVFLLVGALLVGVARAMRVSKE